MTENLMPEVLEKLGPGFNHFLSQRRRAKRVILQAQGGQYSLAAVVENGVNLGVTPRQMTLPQARAIVDMAK